VLGILRWKAARGLFDAAVHLAAGAFELAALGIRRGVVDVGDRVGARVHVRPVAAAVRDHHRMAGRGRVEVGLGERAAFGGLGVVVHEALHPLARRVFAARSRMAAWMAAMDRKIAVHLLPVQQIRRRGMQVRVDESRDDRAPAQVDARHTRVGQPGDLLVGAGREKTPACNRHRLRVRIGGVHGVDVAVDQNQFRLHTSILRR